MTGVKVEIRRVDYSGPPGLAECWLTDANGDEWTFVEKIPYVTEEDLDETSTYPRLGIIPCEIVARMFGLENQELVVIDTERPEDIKSTSGHTRFIVRPDQLEESLRP